MDNKNKKQEEADSILRVDRSMDPEIPHYGQYSQENYGTDPQYTSQMDLNPLRMKKKFKISPKALNE